MGLDSSVPFKYSGGGTLTLTDGTNSLVVGFEQGTFQFSRSGRSFVEARERGRHAATPVVVDTEDGNIEGSFSCLVSSFSGNTAAHPYEVLTRTGVAAGWGSTGNGSRKLTRMILACDSTPDGGGAQTLRFRYCAFQGVDVDLSGAGGLAQLTANFTDFENDPEVT